MTFLLPTLARAGIAALATSALATSITVTLKPLVDMPLPFRPDEIAVAGDRAFLIGSGDCGNRDGLRVIDLADAAAPVVKGFVCVEDPPEALFSVVAEGNIAVVRPSDQTNTLVVIDAVDPDAPRLVGRITGLPYPAKAMRFLDRTRLVLRVTELDRQPIALALVDLSDAAAPLITSQLALPEQSSSDFSDALVVFGDVIYVIEDDIRIIRVTPAGQLEQIGTVPIPTLHWTMSLYVDAEQARLYAVDDHELRLWTYDISRPEAPKLLASGVQLPFPFGDHGPLEMEVAHGIAYTTTAGDGLATGKDLVVFDVSDPRRPRLAGGVAPLDARGMVMSQARELLFVGFEDYVLPNEMPASRGRLFGFRPEISQSWQAWLPALAARAGIAP